MHSNDFRDFTRDRQIEGKGRERWEEEFGIVGMVQHLKEMGWERYQWRHWTDEETERLKKWQADRHPNDPVPGKEDMCFAEFFSAYYHGYLRGDGKTVREAVERCLNRAQRFSECEHRKGHDYRPYRHGTKEYTNGLIACIHCGFNGFTGLIEALKSKVQHLTIALSVEQERAAERVRWAEEHHESWDEQFRRAMTEIAASATRSDL